MEVYLPEETWSAVFGCLPWRGDVTLRRPPREWSQPRAGLRLVCRCWARLLDRPEAWGDVTRQAAEAALVRGDNLRAVQWTWTVLGVSSTIAQRHFRAAFLEACTGGRLGAAKWMHAVGGERLSSERNQVVAIYHAAERKDYTTMRWLTEALGADLPGALDGADDELDMDVRSVLRDICRTKDALMAAWFVSRFGTGRYDVYRQARGCSEPTRYSFTHQEQAVEYVMTYVSKHLFDVFWRGTEIYSKGEDGPVDLLASARLVADGAVELRPHGDVLIIDAERAEEYGAYPLYDDWREAGGEGLTEHAVCVAIGNLDYLGPYAYSVDYKVEDDRALSITKPKYFGRHLTPVFTTFELEIPQLEIPPAYSSSSSSSDSSSSGSDTA